MSMPASGMVLAKLLTPLIKYNSMSSGIDIFKLVDKQGEPVIEVKVKGENKQKILHQDEGDRREFRWQGGKTCRDHGLCLLQ